MAKKDVISDIPYFTKRNRPASPVVDCTPSLQSLDVGIQAAQQHFRDQVNINNIIAKYDKKDVAKRMAQFAAGYDVERISHVPRGDFAEIRGRVAELEQRWELVPSSIRKRFQNDVSGFLKHIDDPKNVEDLYVWGLKERPKSVPPISEPATPPADPKSGS